jgi:N-hydroxyarylamine O-acetyltransferase
MGSWIASRWAVALNQVVHVQPLAQTAPRLYDTGSRLKSRRSKMAPDFDQAEYRQRIGLNEIITNDETGLEAMHRAQVYSIPFENLDIHLGRGIDVSAGAIYRKLVQRPRGGYCFELNGLFLMALANFGFEARPLLARVHLRGEPGGRTHQLSLVTIENRQWIADVGFGARSLRAPMPLEMGCISQQDYERYRLKEEPPWGTMLQMEINNEWQNLYSFDMCHVCAGDIAMGNYYTSTSPDVFFTQMRTVSLLNPEGRVTMADLVLTELKDGEEVRQEFKADASYLGALRTHFGIEPDARIEDFKTLSQ